MKRAVLILLPLLGACATIADSAATLQRTACAHQERVQAAIDLAEAALRQCPSAF